MTMINNKIKRTCKSFFKITNLKNKVKCLRFNKKMSMILFLKDLKTQLPRKTNHLGKLKSNNTP